MKQLRFWIAGLMLVLCSVQSWGQSDNDVIISGGAVFSKENKFVGEAGLIFGSAITDFGMVGYKAGSEFSFGDRFFVAPKVGFEMDIAIFSLRASIINYTDFKHYEPKLTPEIGLSIFGYVNFTYGYNVPLSKKVMDYVPTNRLTLTINIPLSSHYLD